MAELPQPISDDDSNLPTDPFEAELVAYLDGELDDAAARRVEARLATDPAAQRKATALKKTFDLLDFLPKREPSPTFATRTLDRLPAMVQSPSAQSHGSQIGSGSSNVVSGTLAATDAMALNPPIRSGHWLAKVLLAALLFAIGGYAASALVGPQLLTAPNRDSTADELSISDHRVVENLHLYAAVDNLEFVRALDTPEFFAVHADLPSDPQLRPPPEPRTPFGPTFNKQAEAFKSLPAARQQAIRELDRQLFAEEPGTRDRLFQVLEGYAVWLDRLNETNRKLVLAADSPRRRLDEVRSVRNEQWVDSLPPAWREELRKLPAAERQERILRWRKDEARLHEEWAVFRSHAPDIAANRAPWPFESENARQSVIEFMRAIYRTDDEKKCRFSDADRLRYTSNLAQANEWNGWAWYAYGKTAFDLNRKYELLPESADGKLVTSYAQLGKAEKMFEKGRGRTATLPHVGKWPEFALAVHNYIATDKSDKVPLAKLGPARPEEFKEPLRSFVVKELLPALSPTDRLSLEAALGKWPDYSRQVVSLARRYDLVAPGLMLPGSPKRWESLYVFGPRIKP